MSLYRAVWTYSEDGEEYEVEEREFDSIQRIIRSNETEISAECEELDKMVEAQLDRVHRINEEGIIDSTIEEDELRAHFGLHIAEK